MFKVELPSGRRFRFTFGYVDGPVDHPMRYAPHLTFCELWEDGTRDPAAFGRVVDHLARFGRDFEDPWIGPMPCVGRTLDDPQVFADQVAAPGWIFLDVQLLEGHPVLHVARSAAVGVARRRPSEAFDADIGRRVALARAVQAAIPRADREWFWRAYLAGTRANHAVWAGIVERERRENERDMEIAETRSREFASESVVYPEPADAPAERLNPITGESE